MYPKNHHIISIIKMVQTLQTTGLQYYGDMMTKYFQLSLISFSYHTRLLSLRQNIYYIITFTHTRNLSFIFGGGRLL
jgi:hypothetical protein